MRKKSGAVLATLHGAINGKPANPWMEQKKSIRYKTFLANRE
jgi:hypothetical protein